MMILFKRFNKMSALIVVCIALPLISAGCKKKERLSTSTFNFKISPPAATVAKTSAITLTAHGSSSQGAVSVSPTWAVTDSSLGTLNTNIGTSVIFQPSALGDATITAVFDGVLASAKIAIVTYVPPVSSATNPFSIYTDNGIPSGATLFETTPSGVLGESSSGYTPEGSNYMRLTDGADNEFWGIALSGQQDLSAAAGSLKFGLRFSRDIGSGEVLRIQITDSGGAKSFDLVSQSNGFVRTTENTWQEITIPISSFVGLNSAQIVTPFALVCETLTSTLTIDIDAVRWEN